MTTLHTLPDSQIPGCIIHPTVDGVRIEALKAPPLPRVTIVLLVSLAIAWGLVAAHGLNRALAIGEQQRIIARV